MSGMEKSDYDTSSTDDAYFSPPVKKEKIKSNRFSGYHGSSTCEKKHMKSTEEDSLWMLINFHLLGIFNCFFIYYYF